MKQFGILLIMAMWSWSISAVTADAASLVDPFLGHWTNSRIVSAPVDLQPDLLKAHIQSQDQGFQITFTDLGKSIQGWDGDHDINAHFDPANRPGVFEYVHKSGSFLERMFASPKSGNPLLGETLIWARIDDELLAVYIMNVNENGGLLLDHYSWTRTETGMDFSFSQRTDDLNSQTMIEAELLAKGARQ